MNRTNYRYPARVNVKASAGRAGGITEADFESLLASGHLGRTVPDPELWDIAKGLQFHRWAILVRAVRQSDRKLALKDIPNEIWIAINKAKAEYLMEMSQLT